MYPAEDGPAGKLLDVCRPRDSRRKRRSDNQQSVHRRKWHIFRPILVRALTNYWPKAYRPSYKPFTDGAARRLP